MLSKGIFGDYALMMLWQYFEVDLPTVSVHRICLVVISAIVFER
jgi:hypothetical protein